MCAHVAYVMSMEKYSDEGDNREKNQAKDNQ
jgi:hypothetical protein